MNSETFQIIYTLKTEIKKKIGLRNFTGITKQIREFVSLCNSVAIRLLQKRAFTEFSFVKNKSLKGDQWLCRYGSQADRIWQGRLIGLLICGFEALVMKDLEESTKVLNEVCSRVEEIKESGGFIMNDLKIVMNFMMFLIMWKQERYDKSYGVLGVAWKALEASRKANEVSRLNRENIDTVVRIGIAGIMVKLEGNFRLAHKIVKEILEKPGKYQMANRVMAQEFWDNVNRDSGNDFFSEFSPSDILGGERLEEGILEACLAPFILEDSWFLHKQPENFPISLKTSARISYLSDKISTKSSSNSKSETENLNSKNADFTKKINKIDPKKLKISPKRVPVYSPIVGILRPRSIQRGLKRKYLERRPKSQEKHRLS